MNMVFCRGCAKEIHESAVSCPSCGAPQVATAPTNAVAAEQPSNGNVFVEVMRKYAVFNGRARRKEYWMFFLYIWVISFVLGFIEGAVGVESVVSAVFNLAVIIPTIAVGVRRMHDSDHSGWWLLVPFVNLWFLCKDSTPGSNRFGANPKGIA